MIRGTTPAGVEGDERVGAWVRRMFDTVAPRYDLLNHLLSFHMDRWWRWRAVQAVSSVVAAPGARVLDLCCGSGDLLIAMQRRAVVPVLGADFSHGMLLEAQGKIRRRGERSLVFEADAQRLPVAEASFDLVTAAFGFRNLADYNQGLAEMLRVLRRGGMAAILEFSSPPSGLVRALYGFYSAHVLPRIGAAISGSREAYAYLPESVKKFPGAEELAQRMSEAGFAEVRFRRMTAGIVALHIGVKP